MKVLVTGGAGHLGANLLRRLLAAGNCEIRALARRADHNEGLEGIDVEVVWGDLRDLESLRAAVKGVDRIYHAAAQISTVDGNEDELFENNVIGTQNLLLAARQAGCGRVVVTGSFSAVGHRRDGVPSDETVPFNPFDKVMPYEKSKQAVELECLRAVAEGQDVVIATSCAILGPHDYLPSRMGAVLRDFANGKLARLHPGRLRVRRRSRHLRRASSGDEQGPHRPQVHRLVGLPVDGRHHGHDGAGHRAEAAAPAARVADGGHRAGDPVGAVDAVPVAATAADAGRDSHPAHGAARGHQ